MRKYIEMIDIGFSDKKELYDFLLLIEEDNRINARQYLYLRHRAIERFYEV